MTRGTRRTSGEGLQRVERALLQVHHCLHVLIGGRNAVHGLVQGTVDQLNDLTGKFHALIVPTA